MKPLLLIDTNTSTCHYFNSAHELMKYVDSTDGTTFYVKRSLTVPYYRDTKNILLNRYYISSLDNFLKQYPSATFTGVNNTYSYGDKPYISLTIPSNSYYFSFTIL